VQVVLGKLWPIMEKQKQHDLRLVRLSLTLPTSRQTVAEARAAGARLLTCDLGDDPLVGVLLVLDVSEAGRWHLYGLAITTSDPEIVVKRWMDISGAERAACDWISVHGSVGASWNHDNKRLTFHLRNVLGYAFKPIPPGHEIASADRVLGSGILEPLVSVGAQELEMEGFAASETTPRAAPTFAPPSPTGEWNGGRHSHTRQRWVCHGARLFERCICGAERPCDPPAAPVVGTVQPAGLPPPPPVPPPNAKPPEKPE
jgi:hypothetical protein